MEVEKPTNSTWILKRIPKRNEAITLYLMKGGTRRFLEKINVDTTDFDNLKWMTLTLKKWLDRSDAPGSMLEYNSKKEPDPEEFIPEKVEQPVDEPVNGNGDLRGLRVALDVGHGYHAGSGFDPGATGNGLREYDLNALQANTIKRELQAQGAKVSVFNYSDPNGHRITLRAKGARGVGHDVFVSLHHNAFNGRAQGVETLIDTSGTMEDNELANFIHDAVLSRSPFPNRGVRRQGLGVLKGVPTSVRAACLTESFFIDAPGASESQSINAAKSIAQGIARYALANDLAG